MLERLRLPVGVCSPAADVAGPKGGAGPSSPLVPGAAHLPLIASRCLLLEFSLWCRQPHSRTVMLW